MKVGVVGATGLVGQEMLRLLEERAFPVDRAARLRIEAIGGPQARIRGRRGRVPGARRRLLRRPRSGRHRCRRSARARVGAARRGCGRKGRRQLGRVPHGPRRAARGRRDQSRRCAQHVEGHRLVSELHDDGAGDGARAVAPGRGHPPDGRLDVSVGVGRGQAGMHELAEQWTKNAGREEVLRRAGAIPGEIEPGEQWAKPIAGNVIPLAGSLDATGETSEERKLRDESRKILHAPELLVSGTCVRVPVYVGHAMSANVQFDRPLSRDDAVAALADAPGVVLVDGGDGAPTPLESAGIDPVLVGRLRADTSQENTLTLWVTGDNLRKGAALNAVQLAELLAK